ncbi:MAG: histidine phosphatase family protein [Candidatus Doudnabacteria bacterium]|nr:histidine phosphatase family protein [Candidatus Doudnabacteria bacterium]
MKIYLIRHGETLENVDSRLMGRTHGVLSPLGEEQAKKTGDYLKGENIQMIYSSPLNRCLDTANYINQYLNLPLQAHDLLVERDFGAFTNAKPENVSFDMLDKDSEENRSAGVEALSSVQHRVRDFLTEIFQKHPHENLVVVTHNNPIRFFIGEFLDKTYEQVLKEYKVRNCSINVFETNDGKNYQQIMLDNTQHLG